MKVEFRPGDTARAVERLAFLGSESAWAACSSAREAGEAAVRAGDASAAWAMAWAAQSGRHAEILARVVAAEYAAWRVAVRAASWDHIAGECISALEAEI